MSYSQHACCMHVGAIHAHNMRMFYAFYHLIGDSCFHILNFFTSLVAISWELEMDGSPMISVSWTKVLYHSTKLLNQVLLLLLPAVAVGVLV